MSSINIAQLTQDAQKYQMELKYLPFYVFMEEMQRLGINMYPNIENEDIEKILERKGAIAAPYEVDGTNNDTAEVAKIVEKTLKVYTCFATVKDNLKRYKEKTIIRPQENIGVNQTYTTPFQVEVMMAMMKTFAEDILEVIFKAKRDDADKTPLGMFDSFEELILQAILSGEIAAGNGNYAVSGLFPKPVLSTSTDLYTSYESIRDWLEQSDQFLLSKSPTYLKLSFTVFRHILESFRQFTENQKATTAEMQDWFNDQLQAQIVWQPVRQFGTSERLILHAQQMNGEGLLDFGINLQSDLNFVKVMEVPEDPNQFRMWIQSDFGTRWKSYNKKVFYTNDKAVTASPEMSGDYR